MSTFAPCSQRSLCVAVLVIAVLVFGFCSPVLAEDGPKKIRALGNPVTAFSTEPADSVDSLRSQLEAHRADVEAVLRESGWAGDPADFFAALDQGEPTRVVLPPGGELQWMAFRKNKAPVVTPDVVWAPKWAPKGKEQVFDAWQIEVESNCQHYTFLVPVVCLNLSLYETEPVTRAPSCSVEASAGAAACDELAQISISGSTDGDKLEITDVRGGGTSGLSSAGSNSWTYAPSAAGSYQFTATATNSCGQTSTCTSDAVTVPEVDPCVKCAISATHDLENRTITVADDGSVGTLDVTGFTLPDGTSGDMSKLISAGGDRWTYRHKKKRKTGSYTWTFAARAERNGKTATCDAAVSLDVPEPDYAWIFRAVGARIDVDDDASRSFLLPNGSNQRDFFGAEAGTGFGVSIEHVYNSRLGVEIGALIGSFDSYFLRDIDVDWADSEENVDMTMLTLGPNFHLTPGSAVDLYIGPFVGYVNLGSVTHHVLGSDVRVDGEDEFTFGAQIGLDVPTSSSWAFTAGIKWLSLDYDLEEGDDEANELELGIDPLIFTAGVAYRF